MLHSPEQEKEYSFGKEDLGLLLLLQTKHLLDFITKIPILGFNYVYLVGHLLAVDWLVGQQTADLA